MPSLSTLEQRLEQLKVKRQKEPIAIIKLWKSHIHLGPLPCLHIQRSNGIFLEGEVTEPVDNLDYFVGGVLDFSPSVVFSESESDSVVPSVFVVGDGLEDV